MNHDLAVFGFITGAVSAGFLAVCLLFVKFWLRTRDGLFLAFAAAFLLMALGQAATALAHVPDESISGLYLFRLAAFLLIIWAVLRKNFGRR